jgi:hypothetical protein
MLEVPTWLTSLAIATVLIAIGLLIPGIFKSESERTKNKAHMAVLMWVLWSLFQSVLSLNRWYMDRTSGWVHFVFPWLFALAFAGILYFTPRGKRWVYSLNLEMLAWLQLARLPLGFVLFAVNQEKQMPLLFHSSLLQPEILLGIFAIVFLMVHKKMGKTAHFSFHILLILVSLAEIIFGYGAIPFSHQQWSYANPNFAYQHFPFSLIPSVVYPLLLFGNFHSILAFDKDSTQEHQ